MTTDWNSLQDWLDGQSGPALPDHIGDEQLARVADQYEGWSERGTRSPEEFAAHHGHTFLLFGIEDHRHTDSVIDGWMVRFGHLLRASNGLRLCRERFSVPDPDPDELF